MGESEMKMDEQHAGSPIVRIEDKKSDLTAVEAAEVVGDGKRDVSNDAEDRHDEEDDQLCEQQADDLVLNGDADDDVEQDDNLIETSEIIEQETELDLETEQELEKLEENEDEGETQVDTVETVDIEDTHENETNSAGDSKPNQDAIHARNDESLETHVENKNVEFDHCVVQEDELLEADTEMDVDEQQERPEPEVEVDGDIKCEDIEDIDDAEDVDNTPPENVTSSILEDALKNGNSDNSVTLNKMHMEDVREGCDTAQPSSPGHAELRSELTESLCEDTTHQTPESFSATNSIKIEGDSDEEKSIKRKSQDDDDDVDEPTKKLKKEIQQETYLRNKILMEYTEALDMSNIDLIQNEEDKLIVEIQNLEDIAKERERQWNNIIHVKKMKEELLLRIQRQKQVCMMTNGLEISDGESSNHQDATLNGQRSMAPQKQIKQEAQNLSKALQQHNLDMNGHDPNKARTKGPVRNVQSIIADYRQRHPEIVPRRGRRIRNVNGNSSDSSTGRPTYSTSGGTCGGTFSLANVALGSGAHVRPLDTNNEIALLLSNMENGNPDVAQTDCHESSTYKEFLEQIAHSERKKSSLLKQPVPPLTSQFPEVTVHAVTSSSTSNAPTNSLLHGILTKAQVKTDSRTTFSPTLARLLTAPDKTHGAHPNKSSNVSISDILSTNKARSEITITPVTNEYEEGRVKRKQNMEEETEDSVDRLVIDESNDLSESRTDNNSDAGDEVPQCQGCNNKAAQFVCAGCGNQWYCSRECQVTAWDEHSDVCSG